MKPTLNIMMTFFMSILISACATTKGGSSQQSQALIAGSEISSDLNGGFVDTDLGKLYVKDVGTGQSVIVLWPSIFTDHRIYDDLTNRLSDQYRFLLIDGPGHGRSEGPTSEFSISQCAEAMKTVLDYYGIEKAIVGGTSWGGLTAAELVLTNPKRVQALIMMNTPMDIDARKPGLSARFIAFGARLFPGSAPFRNGVANSFFSKGVLKNNPEYRHAFNDMLKKAKPSELAAVVRSILLRGQPLKDRVSQISVKTLVIAGEKDPMYPIETQAEITRLIPDSQFEPVPGKHISVIESPEDVATHIDRFMKGLP